MNILILGGTGAMGVPLTQLLLSSGHSVTVTSRSDRTSEHNNLTYIKGNAKDITFAKTLFQKKWDAVVDFMTYTTSEFKERYRLYLENSAHYIFISSARVYAECKGRITEDSPRLLDVSTDAEYLATDEYALTKARQEDLLKGSDMKNWTVVRPTITYSDIRLQLGVIEKENWLYRALHGRSIVFSEDIRDKYTTMTTADDVASGIAALLGKQKAMGEIFHITSEKSYRWSEILDCYLNVLEEKTGSRPNVFYTKKAVKLKIPSAKYQIIYCRYYDRCFDNSKISEYIDVNQFDDPLVGLKSSLEKFLEHRRFRNINWKLEAYNDKAAGEWTKLSEIPGFKTRLKYLYNRIKG